MRHVRLRWRTHWCLIPYGCTLKRNSSFYRSVDGPCLRPVHGIELPGSAPAIFDSPVFESRELYGERNLMCRPSENSITEIRQVDKSPAATNGIATLALLDVFVSAIRNIAKTTWMKNDVARQPIRYNATRICVMSCVFILWF